MIGGLCKTTLASVGNVSPDEGIEVFFSAGVGTSQGPVVREIQD